MDEIDVKDTKIKFLNILLVEDIEADVKITLRAFSKARLTNNIYVVNNGEEALEFLYHMDKYKDAKEYPRPDLIILDIKLPKLDGFGVLERMKSDQNLNSIPVVMLTTSNYEEDIVRSYKLGAASYMVKPVNFEDFVKTIDAFNTYWHTVSRLAAKR